MKYHQISYIQWWKGELLTRQLQNSIPSGSKRKTKKWYNDVKNYVINEAKWKSANEFCLDNGMEFKILTEEHLNPKYK